VLNLIKPYLVYLPYYFAWLLFAPLRALLNMAALFHPRPKASRLCLEAGEGGWKIIEYQELYLSAQEYLNPQSPIKLVIDRDRPYLSQVATALKVHKPTHYAYSPRTGLQTPWGALIQAFGILFLMTIHRVTPIVFLTDLPVRLWRAQSAVVTSLSGIVVALMPPALTQQIFPHSRMIGPYLMPFSRKTLSILDQIQEKNAKARVQRATSPVFIGSLYEPRTTKLELIRKRLSDRGIQFAIRGRIIGEPRKSDEEYWGQLINAAIVVTTADQIELPTSDWKWIPHFIYRYTEALACGSLLIAPKLQSIERYFVSDEHYIGFVDIDDAVIKIDHYYHQHQQRERVAAAGRARVRALVESNSFWAGIDIALRSRSIT
jgi:hypothetical protein